MDNATPEKIIFPRPFAFAIDDFGWIQGSSLGHLTPSGPYRNGVKRKFDLKDYEHVVEIAKTAGVRVQGLFIVSELDRENVLANYPTCTYLGKQWDNSENMEDLQLEIMQFAVENAAYLEFGFHGTGHEYWMRNGQQRRAEWYNMEERHPWPEQDMREHIEAFKKIMAQYKMTPEHGHSFPESFVACAYSYYWNPDGTYSIGKLMSEAGVKYSNTDFAKIPELNPPTDANAGGFDQGVHVISRLNYGNIWYELQSLPKVPLAEQPTDVIETHWANWLAIDDFLQPEVSGSWIDYYRTVAREPNRYPAKNTEQLHAQWLYNRYTAVSENIPGTVEIDNTNMPKEVYDRGIAGSMVLKIKLMEGRHVNYAYLNDNPVINYFEQEGYGYLCLPPLMPKKYVLNYKISNEYLPVYILHDGTFNVYESTVNDREMTFRIKMYGRQPVKIFCKAPASVLSDDRALIINNYTYDRSSGNVSIDIQATDFQGSSGTIKILF